MSVDLVNIVYLIAASLFVLGLKGLSHPRTAVRGNMLGALGMFIAVVVIVRLVRRQVLKAKYTVLWLTVGLVLAVTASVPTLLDRAADQLGIWYQPTLFLLLAIGFLLLLTMHFSYELSRMEKRIRALAEELALLKGSNDGNRRASG